MNVMNVNECFRIPPMRAREEEDSVIAQSDRSGNIHKHSEHSYAVVPLQLRPYQLAAAEAFRAGARRGRRRMLVQMATGLGKTVLFAHLAHETLTDGGRVLVLAHRDELLGQAKEKLLLADPTADVGIVRAERDEPDARIVVASVQTLIRPNRLARLGRFALVVVDEAHHAAAPSYRHILAMLGAFDPDGPLVLGVTATPGRGDGVGLQDIFEELVYSMGILDGIEGGYLCDLRAVQVTLETDFSGVHVRSGDLADGELADELMAADAPDHVCRAYLDHADGRRALIFTPTVAVAEAMADALRGAGIDAEWVSGETPRDERAAILERLRLGVTDAVANCAVLTEGFDCPPVDCIITARPTRSRSLYTQMIGRGTRTYPGKDDCLVLDVVGQAGRHDLVTAAGLFGLPARTLVNRTVTEALEEKRRQEEAVATSAPAVGRLVSRPIDLFRRRPLHWVESTPGRFVLPVPDGKIVLEPRGSTWRILLQPFGRLASVIGRDLPLEYAQGVAEDHARKLGGLHLADPAAPWRRRPASDKQLAVLQRRGLRIRPGLTAGEASDLIAAGKRGA